MGPIKHQSDAVMELLRSSQTAVHLVTLLEEMPVQETADAIEELRAADLRVGAVVVNQVRPDELDDESLAAARSGGLDTDRIAADLTAAGLEHGETLVVDLLHEAHDHAERRAVEDEQRLRVAELDRPTAELPRLSTGIDLGGLYELAARLREEGMA
jgi:anion-transporting  ArsA/GET3 family ATPase